jgi:dihydroorotase
MITIQNAKTIEGNTVTLEINSANHAHIDATGLTILPALIDPHVHFRTPGQEYKEDWETAARASIRGGYTTVFDMPNNIPSCTTKSHLEQKKKIIDSMLQKVKIPLRYHLYLGADKNCFDQIHETKNAIIGIKVFMGSTEGNLLMDDDSSLHAIFSLAAAHDLIISVHAEDQALIHERMKICPIKSVQAHSWIRNRTVAIEATKKAISLAKIYSTRLNILHVTTKEEVDLIRNAKKQGIYITAETCPHYLLLSEADYETFGTRIQVNPALKTKEDVIALIEATQDGTIDMIGSDHAPHLLEEKDRPYGISPSGIPGIETTLPFLLTAHHAGILSLKRIVDLTSHNIRKIFKLPPNEDIVLIDLEKEKVVEEETLETKCKWSPYVGKKFKGWPVYTILKGNIYHVDACTHLRY